MGCMQAKEQAAQRRSGGSLEMMETRCSQAEQQPEVVPPTLVSLPDDALQQVITACADDYVQAYVKNKACMAGQSGPSG